MGKKLIDGPKISQGRKIFNKKEEAQVRQIRDNGGPKFMPYIKVFAEKFIKINKRFLDK